MDKNLFEVSCTTCEARFAVTDPSLVGEIVACPKCGGMILVEPSDATEQLPQPHDSHGVQDNATDSPIVQEPSDPPGRRVLPIPLSEGPVHVAPVPFPEAPIPPGPKSWELPIEDIPPVLEEPEPGLWNNKLFLLLLGTTLVLFVAVIVIMLTTGNKRNHRQTAGQVSQPASVVEPKPVEPRSADGANDTKDEQPVAAKLPADMVLTVPNATGTVSQGANPVQPPSPQPVDPAVVPKKEGEPPIAAGAKSPAVPESVPVQAPAKPIETKPAEAKPVASKPEGGREDVTQQASKDKRPESKAEEEFEIDSRSESREELLKSLPTLKKALAPVDVPSRLKQPLKSIEFSGQSLVDAVRILSGVSGVPLVFDLRHIERIRPLFGKRIQFHLEEKTLRDAINEMAKLVNLLPQEESGRILLTVPDGASRASVSFDLSGLAHNQASSGKSSEGENRSLSAVITSDEMVRLVRELVDPGSWEPHGGQGTIRLEGNTLQVNQSASNLVAIERLLEQIRSIRRLVPGKEIPNGLLVPEIVCWDTLSQTITLNYFESIPLMDPIGLIARECKLQFLYDDAELARKGINRESPVAVKVNGATVDQALATILTPLKLDYVTLGENLILITSHEAAYKYRTFEIHLFAPPDQGKRSHAYAQSLIEKITKSVAPESWRSGPDGTSVWFDVTSCCFLIRQSQPVQRQVRSWLERHVRSQLPKASAPGKVSETVQPKQAETSVKDKGKPQP